MRDYYEPPHKLHRSSNNIDEVGVLKSQNRSNALKLWRSSSLINLVGTSSKNKSTIYESAPIDDSFRKYASSERLNGLSGYKNKFWNLKKTENFWNSWDTIVSIVLISAKDLPPAPNDGALHELYCKFRLGSETLKSRSIPHSRWPEWRQRLKLYMFKDHMLELSLWDKGRQKNVMGRCVVDLSSLEKERTHDFWQELDEGYGLIHLSLTMCVVRYVPTPLDGIHCSVQYKETILDLKNIWKSVGSLHVKVIKARGLNGRPSAYCTLELDNENLLTHTVRSSFEPTWNKSYVLNVYDITSVFKLKVHGSLMTDALLSDFLGQISIPLLNIKNGEMRWYVLKCRNNRTIARGNCPRILLQMTVVWNPIKATLRLFRPKEMKHISKSWNWDIPLLCRNVVIFANVYNSLVRLNEHFKSLFEWHSREISALALLVWLIFCYHLTPWAVPLVLLLLFFISWIYTHGENLFNVYGVNIENKRESDYHKVNKGLPNKINDFHEVLATVAYVLEIVVSLIERLINLFTFKVPFLSFVFMTILGLLSVVLYFVQFNYLLMLIGIYKFMRKCLNPDRILNNDIFDFISRIPDNRVLKDWKELNVPEPML